MCAHQTDCAGKFTTKFGQGMNKRMRQCALFLGVALLVVAMAPLGARTPQQTSAQPAKAQKPAPQPPQQSPGLRVQVNQVIVPVTVKDGSGRLVPDLRKDEFRILEDNVEQKIVYFSADEVPLSMVMLIDNDLNRKDARHEGAMI